MYLSQLAFGLASDVAVWKDEYDSDSSQYRIEHLSETRLIQFGQPEKMMSRSDIS